MKRLMALLPLAVLAILAVLFVTYGLHRDPNVKPQALVGQPVPALSLPGLYAEAPQAVREAAIEAAATGAPTVINLFASWCAPCELEHPVLLALKAQGVHIIGIAYKDDPAKTKAFLERLGNPFSAVLVDRAGRAGVEFGISGVPESFLIGADGKVLAKFTGPMTPADAEALLEKAH
jgi:cytochrome c biogenesis protein CcmG, thiol:disulfide interchange protein DsbE